MPTHPSSLYDQPIDAGAQRRLEEKIPCINSIRHPLDAGGDLLGHDRREPFERTPRIEDMLLVNRPYGAKLGRLKRVDMHRVDLHHIARGVDPAIHRHEDPQPPRVRRGRNMQCVE